MLHDDLITVLDRSGDVGQALTGLVAVATEAVGFHAGGLVLFNDDGRTARLTSPCGLPESLQRRFSRFRIDRPPFDVLKRDEPLVRLREKGDWVLPGFACVATMPLRGDERVAGVLVVASRSAVELPAEAATLLRSASSLAAELLRRERAEEDVRLLHEQLDDLVAERAAALETARRATFLAAVGEIQRRLLAAGDGDDLYELVLAPLLEASGADRVYAFEYERDASGHVLAYQKAEVVRSGITPQIDNPELQGTAPDKFGREAKKKLSRGEPVMLRIAELPAALRPHFERQDIRSLLELPLTVKGELFGHIGFDNCSDDRLWGLPEIALLTTSATALAAAIERRLALEASRARARELAALLEANRTIASSIDYEEVVRDVARTAGETLGSPQCIVWEYTPEHDRAEFCCLWERRREPGLAESLAGSSYPIAAHRGGLESLRAGEVLQESLSDTSLSPADRTEMLHHGEKTWLTVPLVFREALLGIMILIETEAERTFTANEMRVARALGEQAAVALNNALQHRREQVHNRWLRALVEAGRVIASTLDTIELLDTVARLAAEAILAPVAFIYEYDREKDAVVTRSRYGDPGAGRNDPIGTVFPVSQAPNDRLALDAGHVFVETLSDPGLDPYVRKMMEATGEKTLLNVAFRSKGEALGMLVLIETEAERTYTPDEIDFMTAFGEQAAIALNNAHLYETIEAQATTDGLTGLANHRTFYDRLGQELARAKRYGGAVSLLMIDIDDFKELNDTYGHPAGDEVLRLLGRALAEHLRRDVDLPARYGGEEFAVVLPNTEVTGDAGANALAERLRAHIADLHITVAEGSPVHTTVSIGIAAYPALATGMDELVAHADAALYIAKRAGKNRCAVYAPAWGAGL